MRILNVYGAILIALFMSFCLTACGGDDDSVNNGEYISGSDGVVTTGVASEVESFSATITGTVDASLLTNSSVKTFGVSYGKGVDADESYRTTSTITGTTFTITLTNLTEGTDYYYKAYIVDNNGNYVYGSIRKFTTTKLTVTSGDAIDLGLPSGTKWASRNVGADKPEDHGDYFAWGDTSPKSTYTSDNSATHLLSISELLGRGFIDDYGNLTAAHDAATANWGGKWHMPSLEDFEELINNCTWIKTKQNDVVGYLITGTNGNSIFFPGAGMYASHFVGDGNGRYWSASVKDRSEGGAYAFFLNDSYICCSTTSREYGMNVRPVQ